MESMTKAEIREAKDALWLLQGGNYLVGDGKDAYIIKGLLLMIRYLADRVDTLEAAVNYLESND